MKKIAVIIGPDFEDSEYTKPAEAFKKAGHEIIHIGLRKGDTVKGKKQGTPVQIDLDVKDADAHDFDALLIPGGYSPDNLRAHEEPVRFVKEFMESGKPVFAICHAPQLLITAQTLCGRKVTGYKSIIQDIKNSGADFIDNEVVEDGNLISSRNPNDIPAFIEASLNKLRASGPAVEVKAGRRHAESGQERAA